MTKEEFISRYVQDAINRKRKKERLLHSYFRDRKGKKLPWGYSGVMN